MKKLYVPSPEQKESAKHGETLFPMQKYITKLDLVHPVVTTHWHEEAELTLITEGEGLYQTTMRLLKNLAPWKNLMNFLPSQKNAVSQSLWILLSITVLTSTSGLKRHSQTQTVSMLTISQQLTSPSLPSGS